VESVKPFLWKEVNIHCTIHPSTCENAVSVDVGARPRTEHYANRDSMNIGTGNSLSLA
jgi:hypothetical protein